MPREMSYCWRSGPEFKVYTPWGLYSSGLKVPYYSRNRRLSRYYPIPRPGLIIQAHLWLHVCIAELMYDWVLRQSRQIKQCSTQRWAFTCYGNMSPVFSCPLDEDFNWLIHANACFGGQSHCCHCPWSRNCLTSYKCNQQNIAATRPHSWLSTGIIQQTTTCHDIVGYNIIWFH